MRNRSGSYYADWRDEHGKRHMKAFTTARAAKAHTIKMKKAIAAKKAQAGPAQRK